MLKDSECLETVKTEITKADVTFGLAEHAEFQYTVLKKYLLGNEKTWDDVVERLISNLNKKYPDKDFGELDKLIREKYFIPAGSILSGIGNDAHKTSLSNCYYIPLYDDSIEGIFDAAKRMARTYSYRGGVGVDVTTLRPANASVRNTAKTSTGAVSFLPMFSGVTMVIGQNGRRGALIISLDVRHPDIFSFIWCKSDPKRVFQKDIFTNSYPDISGANLSIKLTDEFMNCVIQETEAKEAGKIIEPTFELWFPDFESDRELYEKEWHGDMSDWEAKGYPRKIYAKVSALDLFNQISESAWTSGDPGVMFWDAVEQYTPGTYINRDKLKPRGMNPCGEQCLPDWNNCLLGAVNLSKMVDTPYSDAAFFNRARLERVVEAAVECLDHCSEINQSKHPLQEQRDADKYSRRLGVEFTGFGDMLAMLGVNYAFPTAEDMTLLHEIFCVKTLVEFETSARLASVHGPASAWYDGDNEEILRNFLGSPYYSRFRKNYVNTFSNDALMLGRLDNFEKLLYKVGGLRHTALNTVGPCGSISIIADNVTSGIEPVYRLAYKRKTRLTDKEFTFIHKPLLQYINEQWSYLSENDTQKVFLEDVAAELNYIEADKVHYSARINMQAFVQEYTDASISSTINLSEDVTPQEIQNAYFTAWKNKLKGITVFRNNCRKGVLSEVDSKEKSKAKVKDKEFAGDKEYAQDKQDKQDREYIPIITDLDDVEEAMRFRVKWKGDKLYITFSIDSDGNPLEVFCKLPREAGINGTGVYSEALYSEKCSLWDTVTRLVSLLLRSGMPVELIVKQLDKSSYSIVDASSVLSRILKTHFMHAYDEEYDEDEEEEEDKEDKEKAADKKEENAVAEIKEEKLDCLQEEEELLYKLKHGLICPDCRSEKYVREAGCKICKACGYSSCG